MLTETVASPFLEPDKSYPFRLVRRGGGLSWLFFLSIYFAENTALSIPANRTPARPNWVITAGLTRLA